MLGAAIISLRLRAPRHPAERGTTMRLTPTLYSVVAAAILAASAVDIGAAPAFADGAAIIVNVTGNSADASGGDGACDADPSKDGDQCTFRAAIQTANSSPGQDRIEFSFAGTSPVVIDVPSALPQIGDPLVIDGYSVANASRNTRAIGSNARLRIVLRGPKSGRFDGLSVAAPSTIAGLVVQSFRSAIYLGPGGEGSFLLGNFIGTSPSGTSKFGNRHYGVHVDCDSAVTIGGSDRAARNIIGASRQAGVLLCEAVDGTVIKGNLIGLGADGRMNVGNGGPGIQGYGSHDVIIGGDVSGARNTIAFNAAGVVAQRSFDKGGVPARAVRILGNSVFRNGGEGIDLDYNGVTINDGPGDPDSGSNGHQNYPVIRSAVLKNGKTVLKGQMFSNPSSTISIRFYQDVNHEREGKRYLGKVSVNTNASGKAWFTANVARVTAGKWITATATDELVRAGDTSEFAASRKVTD
jgi:hypothetical protein